MHLPIHAASITIFLSSGVRFQHGQHHYRTHRLLQPSPPAAAALLYWTDDILPNLDLPLTYSGFRDVCTGLANQSGQIMSNNSNEVMRIK